MSKSVVPVLLTKEERDRVITMLQSPLGQVNTDIQDTIIHKAKLERERCSLEELMVKLGAKL
jgi:hypothetical protein